MDVLLRIKIWRYLELIISVLYIASYAVYLVLRFVWHISIFNAENSLLFSFVMIIVLFIILGNIVESFVSPSYVVYNFFQSTKTKNKRGYKRLVETYVSNGFMSSQKFNILQLISFAKVKKMHLQKIGKRHYQVQITLDNQKDYLVTVLDESRLNPSAGMKYVIHDITGNEFE